MNRNIVAIDATNQTVGRLSTKIATLLIGKHKPGWRPHVDSGDEVRVTNIGKLKFTGKKLEQKQYYHYSGYPGGMKVKKASLLVHTEPAKLLSMAVRQMLPKNKHQISRLKRLHIV